MQNVFHDILDPKYRSPFGAVPAGTAVTLSVFVPESLRTRRARLRVWNGGEAFYDMMKSDGLYTISFTPKESGIYWYWFEIMLSSETLYCHPEVKNGVLQTRSGNDTSRDPYASFQLTVYSPDFYVPEWTKGKIIYQIFPDRFARAPGVPEPEGKRLHKAWDETPEYLPLPGSDHYAADDFFGGNLKGIISKLPYLKSLGVGMIYLNPVFKAYSNHRYDVGDYTQIDPLLGTNEDFSDLCAEAAKLGIRVIIDGVFSHTGSDSVYFNRAGTYESIGAYQSKTSPFYRWYRFNAWPDDYACWWKVWSLPEVDETEPSYLSFITGENGIARKWLSLGASGWRLDVADELPDMFLDLFRKAVKTQDPDAFIIGEVWEDASNKVSYGGLRRYLLGAQLDSVMNYPLRNLIISLLSQKITAKEFCGGVELLRSNYPPGVFDSLMNFLSTHDTARITTILGGAPDKNSLSKDEKALFRLSPEKLSEAEKLHRLAAMIIFSLPGMPCIYYGDELGLQGYEDPFNRGTFPENAPEIPLTAFYRALGALRSAPASPFAIGGLKIYDENGLIFIERSAGADTMTAVINASASPKALPEKAAGILVLNTCEFSDIVPPMSGAIVRRRSSL